MHAHNAFFSLACAGSIFGSTAFAADFNGDGYADLVIGCREDAVNGIFGAGRISIAYGDPTAFSSLAVQTLTQESFGSVASPGQNDLFGFAIQSGDFNGDGFDDLAISSYGEAIAGKKSAGMVLVCHGSAIGILPTAQVFHQNSPGVKDKVEKHQAIEGSAAETFGRTLAAGDFDGDGFDDLAIGVDETLGTKQNAKYGAGAVHVLRGSAGGLTADGNQFFTQDSPGIPGKSKEQRKFGGALVAADFDGNGIDDLAIGAIDIIGKNGSVTVLRGKAGKGLSGKNSVVIDETDVGGVPNTVQNNYFGGSLAAGDFTGNNQQQLVIGAFGSTIGGQVYAGAAYVVTFAQPSLDIVSSTQLARGNFGTEGPVNPNAYFGDSFVVGDFNEDGYDDLVVSAAGDEVAGLDGVGSLNLFVGPILAVAINDLYISQNTPGVLGIAEEGDEFGVSLAAGDYDGDGDTDLAIGIPRKSIAAFESCGQLLLIEGSTTTILSYTQSRLIDKSHAAIEGGLATQNFFASSLGK
jgi:FG-GAP repeat